MGEREMAHTPRHMEGRLGSKAIQVEKIMHIESREKFLRVLGMKQKNIMAELVCNIADSYYAIKHVPNRRTKFEKIVQPVLEASILSPRS